MYILVHVFVPHISNYMSMFLFVFVSLTAVTNALFLYRDYTCTCRYM